MPHDAVMPTRRDVLAGAAALALTGGAALGATGGDRAGDGVRRGQRRRGRV